MLKWGREKASFTIDKAAEKIGIKLKLLIDWETGNLSPTFNELLKISDVYGIPIGVFYLSELPEPPLFMKDERAKKAFEYLKSVKFTPEDYKNEWGYEDEIF